MSGKKGVITNPSYELKCGIVLELNIIPHMIITRLDVEYNKADPEPQPPMKKLADGDEWHDANDPVYMARHETWERRKQEASFNFVIGNGVKTNPPKDFEPMLEAKNAKDLRVLWVYSMLVVINGVSEINDLVNAIYGLSIPTPEGIADAEKKSG